MIRFVGVDVLQNPTWIFVVAKHNVQEIFDTTENYGVALRILNRWIVHHGADQRRRSEF